MTLTPEVFWKSYKEQLRARGSWAAYQSNPQWTQVVTASAISICQSLGLQTGKEYFRLDVIGYEQRGTDPYDWDLRVAFEAENGAGWKDELCKLAHVVADLRVLVTYQSHRNHTALDALRWYLADLRDRTIRTPECRWLFIFGPDWRDASACWEAYTLTSNGEPVALSETEPLTGDAMGCPS